jgi:hypothetical protein
MNGSNSNYTNLNNLCNIDASQVSTDLLFVNGQQIVSSGSGSIEIQETVTLLPGHDAYVINEGTSANAYLTFGVPMGATGEMGETPIFSIGTINTLPYGSSSSVTIDNSDQLHPVLNFTLVSGEDGAGSTPAFNINSTTTLPAGESANVVLNELTETNYTFDFSIPQGVDGVDGISPDFEIGTVTSQPWGATPSVTIDNSNPEHPILNFNLVSGQDGSGSVPVFEIGEVETVDNDDDATVTLNQITPTYYTFDFQIPKGRNGSNGSDGDDGDRGPTGNTGPRGPKGDSADNIGDVISGVVQTAEFIAVQTELALIEGQVVALQAQTLALETSVGTLDQKTLYQSAGIDIGSNPYTTFTSKFNVSNGVSSIVTLDPNGDSSFDNHVQCGDGLTVTDLSELNNVTINGNIDTSINLGSVTESWRNCGIDHQAPITNPTSANDLGSMQIRGADISIGNASQLGNVTINGYITMPLMNSFFGFNVSNGFMSQL